MTALRNPDRRFAARLGRLWKMSPHEKARAISYFLGDPAKKGKNAIQGLIDLIFTSARSLDGRISRAFRHAAFASTPAEQPFLLAFFDDISLLVHRADVWLSKDVFVDQNTELKKVETAFGILEGKHFRVNTVVDVGANIGNISIPMIKRGLTATAIAIEPEPENFRLLSANILLNDLCSVVTSHNVALGREDGATLELALSEDNFGDHRIVGDVGAGKREPSRRIKVRSETFDSIVGELDPNSSLIWMDTQGYEGAILSGATKTLAAGVPLVVEFWPEGMRGTGCFLELREALQVYACWYDLTQEPPLPIPISRASFDELYERYLHLGPDAFCDLLLLPERLI